MYRKKGKGARLYQGRDIKLGTGGSRRKIGARKSKRRSGGADLHISFMTVSSEKRGSEVSQEIGDGANIRLSGAG